MTDDSLERAADIKGGLVMVCHCVPSNRVSKDLLDEKDADVGEENLDLREELVHG